MLSMKQLSTFRWYAWCVCSRRMPYEQDHLLNPFFRLWLTIIHTHTSFRVLASIRCIVNFNVIIFRFNKRRKLILPRTWSRTEEVAIQPYTKTTDQLECERKRADCKNRAHLMGNGCRLFKYYTQPDTFFLAWSTNRIGNMLVHGASTTPGTMLWLIMIKSLDQCIMSLWKSYSKQTSYRVSRGELRRAP